MDNDSKQTNIARDVLTTSTIIYDSFNPGYTSTIGNFQLPNDRTINLDKTDYNLTHHISDTERTILGSHEPIELNETEEIIVNGQRGLWVNKAEVDNWKGALPINQYPLNEDPNPEVITKKSDQQLEYVQELAIRYLRPPTPPAPGEIIINQLNNKVIPPAPPLIIRQQPPRPGTPEPLVIREAPPIPPTQVGRKVITISGKRIPPPPRKVIIERLAQLPSKPQSVIIERWLPYSKLKRKVIFNRLNQPDPVVFKPKNIIVQWEPPKVQVKRDFKYLGVVRANPVEYVKRYGNSLILSENLPKFVLDIQPPEGVVLAADYKNTLCELEGDVDALKLVDLEKEGLGEYKSYLQRLGVYNDNQNRNFINNNINVNNKNNAQNVIHNAVQNTIQAYIEQTLTNKTPRNINEIFNEPINDVPNTPINVPKNPPSPSILSVSESNFSDSESIDTLIETIFKSMDSNSNGRISVKEAEKLLLILNSRLERQFYEDDVKSFFKDLDISPDGTINLIDFKRAFLNLVTIN